MCSDAIRCDPTDMAADDAEVLVTALSWMKVGRSVRLAVVLETWGSAPRSRGSYMAVAGDGAFAGSVSGGCVESAVISEACEMEEGEPPPPACLRGRGRDRLACGPALRRQHPCRRVPAGSGGAGTHHRLPGRAGPHRPGPRPRQRSPEPGCGR
ncbi:XdhC family protein [Magnetospirillum sp. SS-4]|uniref:XdhC family protein n=1 Tax=Magnetospirillum sp. SS-4 TaxID=2681465 RepID=UPI00137FB6E2|nr:hypothetical protein MTBSS4_60136 [Magnetospirillum sp. SS-4]